MRVDLFDFDLPLELIAQEPIRPRDAARLLLVDDDAFRERQVRDLPDLLRPDDLLVLNDTRVMYVEPAKWVARLREVGADALLKCEMVAGHGGVSGRYNAWRERAFELAWLLDVLGVAEG